MGIKEFFDNIRMHKYSVGELDPSIAEEYLDSFGTFDPSYVNYILKEKVPTHIQQAVCHDVFGKINFEPNTAKSEVSKEEFLEVYKFGKYLNTREWISHLARVKGKLLTREALFEYLPTEPDQVS